MNKANKPTNDLGPEFTYSRSRVCFHTSVKSQHQQIWGGNHLSPNLRKMISIFFLRAGENQDEINVCKKVSNDPFGWNLNKSGVLLGIQVGTIVVCTDGTSNPPTLPGYTGILGRCTRFSGTGPSLKVAFKFGGAFSSREWVYSADTMRYGYCLAVVNPALGFGKDIDRKLTGRECRQVLQWHQTIPIVVHGVPPTRARLTLRAPRLSTAQDIISKAVATNPKLAGKKVRRNAAAVMGELCLHLRGQPLANQASPLLAPADEVHLCWRVGPLLARSLLRCHAGRAGKKGATQAFWLLCHVVQERIAMRRVAWMLSA